MRLAVGLVMMAAWLSGCGGGTALGPGQDLRVGQREAEVVAALGAPEKVLPGPAGAKTYVYTRINMDQVGVMGGGAWGKPEETHIQLDPQGVITQIKRYPYGKRRFIVPAEEPPASVAAAPVTRAEEPPHAAAAPAAPAAAPPVAPAPPAAAAPAAAAPREAVPSPAPRPAPAAPMTAAPAAAPPAAAAPPPSPTGMEAASRLELNMTREEVRRILGVPERTEGFRLGGKAVVVWFYLVADPQGRRVSTPLVFENGRLSGWGDTYYRRVQREANQ